MYDIIYIGGGLNYAGAIVAAKNSLKVALIEKSLAELGGVCLHKGCIPSKMFLHFANTIRESRNDIFVGSLNINMQTLVEKKNRLVKNVTKAVTAQCGNIDLIEGEAKITAPHKVTVDDKIYEAKYIVIGSGSSAFIPDGIEYDKKDIITSNEVLDLITLPKDIAIYGDGAIGLEMASFFAASGIKVTLISRAKGELTRAHPLIQDALQKQIEKEGILHLTDHPIKIAKTTSKGVHITFEDKSSKYFEKMLVATGRKPNIDVVKTDKIKVERGIITDENFESTLKDHYAIGDCNGKLQLAHAARAQTLFVTHKIIGKKPKMLNLDNVVKFIHTLPMSYATVGQNRASLEQKGISFKESVMPLNRFSLSAVYGASDGFVIVYADNDGFILGGELFAPNAEELIAPLAMALAGEMDVSLAQKTIMAHPTFSEALERAYFRL
jgi:dihydrolipoamide dehydrogenase